MTTKIGTLKAMRLEKRLTQAEVAAKMKVSQSYYSGIEQGNKPGEVAEAMQLVNRMRFSGDRTLGGAQKAGRRND